MSYLVFEITAVLLPDNKLEDAYLKLAERACSGRPGGLSRNGRWHQKAVRAYLKKEEMYRLAIGLAMQGQGGQVARWTELQNIWCETTEYGPRGLFAYKAYIVYICHFEYLRNCLF